MAAESGLEGPAVALHLVRERLLEDPTSSEFFHVVHLLERMFPERREVGRFADPDHEVARFSVHPSIAFPLSEIDTLEIPAGGPARIGVNFMGLVGPQGVLPHSYTLLVAERQRARDGALADFLDIFHHRMISLLYRAWKKYRFTVSHGADFGAPQRPDPRDGLTRHLLDLVGAGLDGFQRRLPVDDRTLIFYAGLLGPQPRSALALEQLLEDYFGVPVEVQQFVGGWFPLTPRDQCALGENADASTGLGVGAVAGAEVWDQQCRVRLRLGPLTREQFDDFLPGGRALEPLRALVRFFTHDQFDFEVQLVLARDDVPRSVLGADHGAPSALGWSTWLRSTSFSRDADETVFAL